MSEKSTFDGLGKVQGNFTYLESLYFLNPYFEDQEMLKSFLSQLVASESLEHLELYGLRYTGPNGGKKQNENGKGKGES